jgi:predicted O-methyltransferase YrrM
MNNQIDILIRELLERHRQEKDKPLAFREKMLAMGSEGGRLVETIVRSVKPKRGLEIGTSSGFSALCALKGDDSGEFRLVTVDFDPAKAAWAKQNFERAGVTGRVEVWVMDGLAAAEKIDGPLDYVLLDAAKSQNLPILKTLLPKLSPGAVILTDNMLTHEEELREFAGFVRNHPELASGMYAVGNGIEVTFKLTGRLTEEVVAGDRI